MSSATPADLAQVITDNVAAALREDVGSGDLTAGLIPAHQHARARIITRAAAVVSGTAWVDEVFRVLDPAVEVRWQVTDGERSQRTRCCSNSRVPRAPCSPASAAR